MILINFASRSRPQKFHSCIENIAECFTDYFILAKIDSDDPFFKKYVDRAYPEVRQVIGKGKSKVYAINNGVPDEGWDILINTSDDIKWLPGAGEEIQKQMEADTFLHFPEVYADGQAKKKGNRNTISVVSIMDKIYYDRTKNVYNPAYKSLWCDNEATEVARKLGRYKFVDKYIFQHIHPVAGYGKKDELLRYTESFYKVDKETFLTRQGNNFDL